jgi:hypothetical protein
MGTNVDFPDPPDPRLTAQAQMDVNRQAAADNTRAQAINQVSPYGTLTYTQDGTWSDGTPRFTATTALSPQAQDTINRQIGVQNNYATVAGDQLDQARGRLATPFSIPGDAPKLSPIFNLGGMPQAFDPTNLGVMPMNTDFSKLPAMPAAIDPNSIIPERARIEEGLLARLEPGLERDRLALENSLVNQGFQRGTPAFEQAMDEASRARNDARLAVIGQGGSEQRNIFDMMNSTFGQQVALRNMGLTEATARRAQELEHRDRVAAEQRQYVDDQVRMRGITEAEAGREFDRNMQIRQQLINEALAERNQPLQEMATLMTGAAPQMPTFQATPRSTVAPADLAGLTMDAWRGRVAEAQAQQQMDQAMMSGLFQLAGAGVGAAFGAPSMPFAGWRRR